MIWHRVGAVGVFVLAVCGGISISVVASATAAGELSAVTVSASGTARLRYEDTQGYGAAATSFSRASFWSVRVRPRVEFALDEKATVVLEPQFAKALGRPYSYLLTDSSGASAYNENFHAHQGYLLLNLGDGFTVKGGRFAVSYGGQLILGVADWGISGRSFDGLSLGYKADLVAVDFAHLKVVSSAGKFGEDRDLNVLYSQWNLAKWMKAFDLYALYESDLSNNNNESRFGAGLRVKAQFEGGDFTGEYSHESGTRAFLARDEGAAMMVVEAGYTFEDFAKLRVGLELNQADDLWLDWYPLTKAPLGRNDIVGRRNLTSYALRLASSPWENWKVSLDYWIFSRTKNSSPAFRTNSTTAVGSSAVSSASDIGQSIETSLSYKVSDRLEYGIGIAYFMQGEYLKQSFGDRELTDFYVVTNVTF